jgi:ribosomal protein S27AE
MSQGLQLRENPCPVCGSTDFTWGMPIASPSVGELTRVFIYFTFKTEERQDGEIPLETRCCNQCGNVLFFTIDR